MAQFTAEELRQATGGELRQGAGPTPVFGVSTDSRNVQVGEVFVALVGEAFDGHNYVAECLAKGAVGVIVSRSLDIEIPKDAFVLEVENTLHALQDIACFHRSRFSVPVIGITGSNGKTTTKDLIAAVLSQRFITLKTQANFNNEIGLPKTLLGLTTEHEAAVVEMGMRGLGEIRELAAIALPTMAVVTNVSETHIELLRSIENIAKAKAELVEALDEQGVAFLNGDDIFVRNMASRCKGKVIYYGSSAGCDVRAVDIEILGDAGTKAKVIAGDRELIVTVPVPGRHNVVNAMAAVAVGLTLGLSTEEIQNGISQFAPSAMRMDIKHMKQGYKLINDVYNASPLSMRAAIDTLCDIAEGRKIAVLGDMLELGEISETAHREIGRYAARQGVTALLTFGTQAYYMVEGALEVKPHPNYVENFQDMAKLSARLREIAKPGDTVLIKGSRGMRMERVGTALEEN
jgi:UDP-N-acetylmuramoyl-tripeptide--D-alanyl-D-alanine ligase